MPLMLGSVRRTRSRPVMAMERPPLAVLFRGLGSGLQQAFCRSVYAHALLATIVLYGIGIPAAHENSPGMRRGQSHAGAVMRNDRSPFSEVRDKAYRPPRFRVRKGTFYRGIFGPNVPLAGSFRPVPVTHHEQLSGIAF